MPAIFREKTRILLLPLIALCPFLIHSKYLKAQKIGNDNGLQTTSTSQDPTRRYLVVKKTYSRKKFRLKEQNYVWLEFRADNGSLTPTWGVLDDIRESSVVMDGREIPLNSISRVKVPRQDRGLLICVGAAFATLGIIWLAGPGPPDPGEIAYGLASIPVLIWAFSIDTKVPIGGKFRISTEPY